MGEISGAYHLQGTSGNVRQRKKKRMGPVITKAEDGEGEGIFGGYLVAKSQLRNIAV